jgi:putative transposase
MALSESAVFELLDAFRAGDGVDLIRDAVTMVLQELIEVEAIGAGRCERSDSRVTDRNGHRPRLSATQAGDSELRIPKLRKGSFFPSILGAPSHGGGSPLARPPEDLRRIRF